MKEPLINSAVSKAQGDAACFGRRKRLKMKQTENYVFSFAFPDNARDGVNQGLLM